MVYDPLPVGYRKSASAIATFPYSEIADGTGIVEFKGSKISIDATPANDVYILNTGTLVSSDDVTTVTSATDLDFDVQFNLPKTIEGFVYVVMPISVISDGVQNQVFTPKITLRKWDGSTEKELVAETSAPSFETTAAAELFDERVLRLTCPRESFASGDIFRITFTATVTGTLGVSKLYHIPPAGKSDFDSGGRFSVSVPFILDI